MPKLPRVTLLKQVKVNDTWRQARALFDSKGRVRRDHVRFNGKDETHPEGSYFIEWWDEGKRHCEPAGADAQDAADKARVKQAELTAQRNGILPPAPTVEAAQERTSLPAALDSYLEYVRYHRSLRTFRTYRPILESFKESCPKTYVDEVERQDLLDFATHCMKKGQKGKSIYNKLVVISQVMKQHGKRKLLNAADWPSFVETVRPICEDFELTKIFKACTLDEQVRFKFYLRFRQGMPTNVAAGGVHHQGLGAEVLGGDEPMIEAETLKSIATQLMTSTSVSNGRYVDTCPPYESAAPENRSVHRRRARLSGDRTEPGQAEPLGAAGAERSSGCAIQRCGA